MKLPIRLFVQKHDNRTYTVMAPALPGLSGYGPTLEEVKQEIAEALVKRLGEIPPEFVPALAAQPNDTFARIMVDLWPHDHQGRRRRAPFKLTASLMITPQDDGQALVSVPRLSSPPLAFFVPSAEALAEIAQAEIAQYFSGAPLEVLLQYQGARHETFDTIEVEFTPRSPTQEVKPLEEQEFWALRASGVNLTAQASEGQLRRAYRRDREVEEVLAALADDIRPSLILVGPPGAGKTAIVHEAARRIRRKECPEALHDRELWAVSGASLIAGMTFIGQWQEKLTNLVQEVRKKRHILFVEDIAGLADAGRWSKSDENMADFLKPYIQSGDVVVIGEGTAERLRYTERLTPSFLAQFRTQKVEPMGDADTMSVLTAVSRTLERAEEVRIDASALEAAAELTSRFVPGRAQPGKAVALLEQTTAGIGRQQQAATGRRSVIRKDVVTAFTRQTGLPEFILSDETPLDLAAVRRHFVERVIGQDKAAAAMVDLVATVKAGLNDPDKPLGTFLFIGPTGVGKTQLAKTLAKYLFGAEQRVLRFDMSEYGDPAGLRRLIGMPGLGNEGELTAKVRSQPFCVLLLDEFEKADPQIYDIFLQVMGEGRLTDATGQATSFQNAIVIMTSNLGARAREQRSIGLQGALRGVESGGWSEEGGERMTREGEREGSDRRPSASYWQRKVEEYFRPEFVNRIDQIVVFDPLGVETVRQIARRELGEVMLRQGLVRRNLLLEVDDNVVDLLLDQGFNTAYGARPLKRAVERLVVLPLARYLASRGRVESDLLRLERRGNEVVLSASRLSGEERTAEVLLGGEMLAGGLKRRRVDDRDLVEAFAELRRQLQDWAERDAVVEMRNERAHLLAEINKPTFWDDGRAARGTMSRFYFLDRLLRRMQQLSDRADYLEELAGLVYRQRDARYRSELAENYERLARDCAFLEVELLCAHIVHNHRAVVLVRPVGPAVKEDGPFWASQLAGMYLRWAKRKGYDAEAALLEPLSEAERRSVRWDEDYPYRWRGLAAGDPDGLIKEVEGLPKFAELAILLEGTNIYGFLKGEAGVHRRNEQRPSGERTQQLVEVSIDASGEGGGAAWLEYVLERRAEAERELAKVKGKKPAAKTVAPEVVRVYQFEGQRHVRDLRTKVRNNDLMAVLEGDLDDFILAYLRETEAETAWDEPRE